MKKEETSCSTKKDKKETSFSPKKGEKEIFFSLKEEKSLKDENRRKGEVGAAADNGGGA